LKPRGGFVQEGNPFNDPLIVYYNQDIFDVMGLEQPSSDWSWDMFDQTIATLQGAGHNVHIMLSPFTLE